MYKEGEFLTFIDTAGIRQTEDEIEKAGIDRSFQEAQGADIILLVIDQSQKVSKDVELAYQEIIQNYPQKIIVVYNKMEKSPTQKIFDFSNSSISVSAKNNQNIDLLYQEIFKKINELKGTDSISCLLSKRQYDLLFNFYKNLQEIRPMLNAKRIDYELVSLRLKDALTLLSELTGRSVSEAAFDKVFDTFCVGK